MAPSAVWKRELWWARLPVRFGEPGDLTQVTLN